MGTAHDALVEPGTAGGLLTSLTVAGTVRRRPGSSAPSPSPLPSRRRGARRRAPRRTGRFLLLACALLAAGCAAEHGTRHRHIVLILIDTLRRDALPMFGGETKTPHIAALAARGRAIPAFASFHQTTMSMGALFTGHTPSIETGDPAAPLDWLPAVSCGMARFTRVFRDDVCLPDGVPTLGEKLRAAGYHTVGVVANPLLFDPAGFSRGFDSWQEVGQVKRHKPKLAAASRTWQQVNAAVRKATAGLPDAPVFLYVHYLDVHDWLYRGLRYPQAVEEMDRGVGDLLSILKGAGLLSDAAIVLAADHGELIDAKHVIESLPLHFGNPSYRDVLEIPLVLVGADDVKLPPFLRVEDLHYLLLELAGAKARGPRDLADGELFLTELMYQTYQKGRFKSFHRRDGPLVLIDLEQDPGETRDVAAQHPDVVEAHRKRVEALTRKLAAEPSTAAPAKPSRKWLERLRALGYVQ